MLESNSIHIAKDERSLFYYNHLFIQIHTFILIEVFIYVFYYKKRSVVESIILLTTIINISKVLFTICKSEVYSILSCGWNPKLHESYIPPALWQKKNVFELHEYYNPVITRSILNLNDMALFVDLP